MTKKRIAIISEDLSFPWDEGIKNFAYFTGCALRRNHEVKMINVDRSGVGSTDGIVSVRSSRTFLGSALRRELRSFKPDITLYVPSPSSTVSSFMRSFALRRHVPDAALGMVALIPRRHARRLRPVLAGTAPDVVFVPSNRSLLHLSELSINGSLLPVGVDLSVFRPPIPGEKMRLRKKYGIGGDSYVYLHVGHITQNRNVRMLPSLLGDPGVEVVVVGSTTTDTDASVRAELEQGGVRVVREFVPIEEYYRLADCYVFPVAHTEGSVEIPLSVVEALACGVPVLSRPFGGLRDFLPEGDDLVYWETAGQLRDAAEAMRRRDRPDGRSMAAFTWDQIANTIVTTLEKH